MKLDEAYNKMKALEEMQDIAVKRDAKELYNELAGKISELQVTIYEEGYRFDELFHAYKRMKESQNKYIAIGGASFSNTELLGYTQILIDNGFTDFVYSKQSCSWAYDLITLEENGFTLGNVVRLNGACPSDDEYGIVIHLVEETECDD